MQWAHLPPLLRRSVEGRLGTTVVEARSQDAGFTPGMAAVLVGADGTRHFVKAASVAAQRTFAEAYREEARKLAALPPAAPAAPLRWVLDEDGWVVLCTAYVEGRAPARPWRQPELDALLDALGAASTALTPVPPGLAVATFAEEFGALRGHWDHVRATRPDLSPATLDDGAHLAALALEVTAGDTLVHTDVRDDNVLLRADGSAVLCDWNWPVRGAAWVDTAMALVGPRGDGLDVEGVLAARPLLTGVPAEHVDALLALLLGYFCHAADQPVPPTSPHLRAAQAWQRDVVLDWLRERRGWA
nr:phosphotransferase [Nocardioides perillae]